MTKRFSIIICQRPRRSAAAYQNAIKRALYWEDRVVHPNRELVPSQYR